MGVVEEDTFLLHLYSLELKEDDPVMCLDKEILTKDVADKLEKNLYGLTRILYSPMNANKQVIRLRFIYGEKKQADENNLKMTCLQDYLKYAKLCCIFYLKG